MAEALELECVSESPARLPSGDRWAHSQLQTCQVGTEPAGGRVLLVQGRDLEKPRPQGRRARSSREEAAGARGGTWEPGTRPRVVRAKLRPGAVGSGRE